MPLGNVIPNEIARKLLRAVCVLITRDSPDGIEILAVSRKDDHTRFGLPGGKVDPGEDPHDAARRELEEETGLRARSLVPVFSCPCRGDVTYYTATYKTDLVVGTPENKTGEGIVKWVKPAVLLAGPFGEYNKNLFDVVKIPY